MRRFMGLLTLAAALTGPSIAASITPPAEVLELEEAGRLAELDTEPAARTDARVVEVEVRLHDSAAAEQYTNLQVEVEFLP